MRGYGLLSAKPMLVVANVAEDDLEGSSGPFQALKAAVAADGGTMVVLCAALKARSPNCPRTNVPRCWLRWAWRKRRSARWPARLTNCWVWRLLHRQRKEVRSWIIRQGATAPEAGGSVHSDIERGFIRAECYHVDELCELGSEKAIKEAGKLRSEGKQYVMQDGDVVHFLFNV